MKPALALGLSALYLDAHFNLYEQDASQPAILQQIFGKKWEKLGI
jgi:hypothetical protein